MGHIPKGGRSGRRWRRSVVAVVAVTMVASTAGWATASHAGWATTSNAAATTASNAASATANAASAQPDGPDQPELAPGLPTAAGLPPQALVGKIGPRLGTARGPVAAFVELAQPAAVDVFEQQRRSGQPSPLAARAVTDARNRIGQTVDQVLGELGGRDAGTRELFRTTNAVPGVAVTADAGSIREIAASPAVRSVHTMVPKSTSNASTVQLTGTLRAWQQAGLLGDGMRVGVIDDGIDYTHADFGGPGTTEAYEAVDPTVVDPATFPTPKVVGGVDFAGDDYDASGEAGPDGLVPRPDPNPLSCGQHGTHVAGTAAGFGVNGDGSTFRGDYRALDPAALGSMRVGPGTAPKASLYALKVFGCGGSTNLVAQALDWTLDPNGDGDFSDRLDVVNLSLGSDYGAPDDPDSLFVRKLAQTGVLPVFAAGNGGDLFDIGGSPGNTPEALTVASTKDSSVLRDGAEVTAPGGVTGVKGGQYSEEFTGYDTLDREAPVVPLSDPANLDGCQPFTPDDAAAVRGRHVWLEWDDDDATRRCGTAARADNAQAAGAAGVLLTSRLEQFSAGLAGNAAVPMFQFTGPDTDALRPAMEAGTLRVRLLGSLRAAVPTSYPEITDTPSVFTSRDVRGPAVKPDVAAPGDTIASALNGSGAGTLVISGTSMASPHVAGIAALVRQAHPEWSVAQVKSAVMNTADADVFAQDGRQGPIEGPTRVGSGRVNAAAAVHGQVLATVPDDPGQASASFGVVEAATPRTLRKTIRVSNTSDRPVSYQARFEPIATVPGTRYELSDDEVDLDPHEDGELTLTFTVDDPAALRRTADPTLEKVQLDAARQFLAEATGRVVLTPEDRAPATPPLRVPVYAAPKPVADITAPDTIRMHRDIRPGQTPGGADQTGVLPLSGRGLDQGSGDAAYRSLVSVLQLQATSGRLPACNIVLAVDCTPNETAKAGDLRYVGATSTAPLTVAQGRPEQAQLAFGIATWGDWYNLGNNTIPYVDIDTTGDGAPDFEVIVTKPDGTDLLVAATIDLNAPGMPTVGVLPANGQFGDVDTGVFDTNVVLAPVSLASLGIDPTAASAPISYTAGVAGYYTGPADSDGVIDATGRIRFDATRPALWAQGGGSPALSYLAQPGTALVVHRNAESARRQLASRLLVLHPLNASGDRVQVVRAEGGGLPAVDVPVPDVPEPQVPAPDVPLREPAAADPPTPPGPPAAPAPPAPPGGS